MKYILCVLPNYLQANDSRIVVEAVKGRSTTSNKRKRSNRARIQRLAQNQRLYYLRGERHEV